jgi:hypothetical protein
MQINHPGMIAGLTIACVLIWAFTASWAYLTAQERMIRSLKAQPVESRDEWIRNYCKRLGVEPS